MEGCRTSASSFVMLCGPRTSPVGGVGVVSLVSAFSRPRPERNPMSITSRRVLPLAAIVALLAVPATANAADHGPVVRAAGHLADLQPATAGPFDGATAAFQIVASARGSHGVLRVKGIDPSADGETFGAHLHAGPCVAGNGAAALGHYNTDVLAGIIPPEVSEDTEMWLDITVED